MMGYFRQCLTVWIIKKIQKYGPRRVRVLGRTYEISEDVFNPKFYFTSAFMAKHIRVSTDDTVLDMGTGSGIQAITAGQTASRVVAVDINPEAVRYARKNVIHNGMENVVSIIEGDLFSALGPEDIFSIILFTPPYLEGNPKTVFDNALYDRNKELLDRFFREARNYIRAGGCIQMVYSSIAGAEEAVSIAARHGWHCSVVARENTYTEEFLIYRFT